MAEANRKFEQNFKEGAVHGFPRARTSFVGRDDDITEVISLLDKYQLVTITGPGGVGKTRLASEMARRAAARFADGAWLVELAGVHDPGQVPGAVAVALGIQPDPGVPLAESLVAALTRQQLLLVLDNCEHVLATVAELCGKLLAVADDMRLLTTSREPIGLPGEVRYRLRPLPVPEPGENGGLASSAAVALFAERAKHADPRLVLTGEMEPLVARLVARLDGMPLAIELAAARIEALGLSQLLDRLEDDFRLLTSSDRVVHQRHRSLAATVQWSYELLDEPERRVFRRLAVFPGPFTLGAAMAVAGPPAEAVVLHLVDCSLITPPRTGNDGRVRYLILETLRDFGRSQLTIAGERAEAEQTLAGYAVQAAEQAAAAMAASSGEAAAVRWLDAENATMNHALRWCLDHELSTGTRLAIALSPWLGLQGRAAEAYDLLNATVSHVAPQSDLWCSAQLCLGEAATVMSRYTVALGHFTAARDGVVASGPSPALARALAGRADALVNLGRISEGTEEARQALDLSRDTSSAGGQAWALQCMAVAALHVGNAGEAVEWARQASQIDPESYSGDEVRSIQLALAVTLMEAGDTKAAREHCVLALSAAQDVGDSGMEYYCAYLLADLALRSGDLGRAWVQLESALRVAMRTSSTGMHNCLSVGGELCGASGDWEETVTVLAADRAFQHATGIAERSDTTQRLQEPLRRAARALGPESARAAEQRGAAMSVEAVTEYLRLIVEAHLTVPAEEAAAPRASQLSVREQELVTLVAKGKTDAQISGQLYISVSTVRSHLDRIRDKTGCRRRADLTRLALQAGFV
jgi:predicted ATPase/DNA-binding CsgD family transcriptional regulator